jgi:hypothetical protein
VGGAPATVAGTGSGGLRTATIVLFWCTAGASVLAVIAFFSRRSAWVDFTEGSGSASAVDDADDLVSAALGVTFLLALASLILVSLWSLRVTRRARAAGATDVSPGLACGSWYIPYASAIVPFIPLRRTARRWQRPTGLLNVWQACYIALWVTGTAVMGLEPTDEDAVRAFFDPTEITDKLTAQAVFGVLSLVALFVMAFAAMQAMRTIDDT